MVSRPKLRATSVGGMLSLLAALVACSVALGLLLAGVVAPAVGAVAGATRGGIELFEQMPDSLTEPTLTEPSRILTANGELIASPQDQNRISVKLAQVAPIMRTAQVAIEDHRFYEHGGLDLQGTVRAFVSTLRGGGAITQGGSSLTQQYVKQALQYNALAAGDEDAARAARSQSYLRKIKELKYAMALEEKFTKDQILEKYLNIVYYGDRAYGVEAASLHYFSKHASQLTLSEAALLAGLVQNPSTTDPIHFPARALARRNVVLDRMHTLELINDKDWAAAKARPVSRDLKVSYPKTNCASSPYPYFCDYIMVWLQDQPALGATREERLRRIQSGGLTIKTTFDPKMQAIVNEEITKLVPVANGARVGAAAFVTEPGTGKVVAFGQNTQYVLNGGGQFRTAVDWALETQYGGSMGFQFGSTAKAFALVTAFESGIPIHYQVDARAADDGRLQAKYTSADFPQPCGLDPGVTWPVHNDSYWAGGPLDLLEATRKSTNTFFVGLVQQLGACKVRDTETRLGMSQGNGKPVPPYPPSIILGATEAAPQTVARAYAVFASEGKLCQDMPVTSITQGTKTLYTGKPDCKQVIDPEVARAVNYVLHDNVVNGSGKKASLWSGQPAAGKTGTANNNNESWFVGYTPQLSVAVWVGTPYDPIDRRMFNVCLTQCYPVMHGAAIAAPIWRGIVGRMLDGQPIVPFAEPSPKMLVGDLTDLPSVRGMYFDQAKATLEAAGFRVAQGRDVASYYAAGKVERTAPAYRAPLGSMVTLYLSSGVRPKPRFTATPTVPPSGPAVPTTPGAPPTVVPPPVTTPTAAPAPTPTKTKKNKN